MDQRELKEFTLSLNKARECHGKKIALLEKDVADNAKYLRWIWLTIAGGFIASLAGRYFLHV